MNIVMDIFARIRLWFYNESDELGAEEEMLFSRTIRISIIVISIFLIRFIVDCIFVKDTMRLVFDLFFTLSFALITWHYYKKRIRILASLLYCIVINVWLFYNANYFGKDGMVVLLVFCTTPYAYYVVGSRVKWLLAIWLLLPCITFFALELGEYSFFPNHRYMGTDITWSRMMVVFSSFVVMITLMFSIRMLIVRREQVLTESRDELLLMVDRIEALTQVKERNNVQLREELQKLVEETKRISIESSLEALRSEERERARTSTELMESLGGLLLAMKYRFEAYFPVVQSAHRDEYREALRLIDKALLELYETCGYIQTEQLYQMGLIEALRQMYQALIDNHPIHIKIENVNYGDELSREHELIVYRTMALLINCSIRYINPYQSNIKVQCSDEMVMIYQYDEAIDHTEDSSGINDSLRQVRELVALVGGMVHHKSVVGKGATTLVQVPIIKRSS
jgi:signal transduction histidine kinase